MKKTALVVAAHPAPTPVERPGVVMKRVSFCVPEPLYNDLQEFADERGDSMTGVIRWSLGMSKAIWDELKTGNRIQVHSPEHKPLKELIFSPY
jgi:hypothetical protein